MQITPIPSTRRIQSSRIIAPRRIPAPAVITIQTKFQKCTDEVPIHALEPTYFVKVIFGMGTDCIGSNKPNEKIAVADAIATYCLPSTS